MSPPANLLHQLLDDPVAAGELVCDQRGHGAMDDAGEVGIVTFHALHPPHAQLTDLARHIGKRSTLTWGDPPSPHPTRGGGNARDYDNERIAAASASTSGEML